MIGFFKRLQGFLYTFLGLDKLSTNFLKFAKAHLTFTIALNIHSVFVNILLLRSADDINITLTYNITNYLCTALGMMLAGALVKKMNLKIITITGISLYVCAYALFLIFMNDIVSCYLLIAFLLGVGAGFFYLTYFNSISLYSEDESRDVSLAFLGLVSSFVALVVPSIAGSVIGAFENFTGYNIMFACAFVISAIAMFLFIRLPRIHSVKESINYPHCIKQLFTNPCWRGAALQVMLRSIREGIFLFFLNVLLFEYIPSETVIGFNALICGFIGIFAQSYCGKFIRPNNRTKTMAVATTMLLAVCSLLLLGLNAISVLMLSFVNAFFVVLLMNPAMSIDFLVIASMPDGYSCRSEYFALFELYRNIGRVIGVCLIIIFPKEPLWYIVAMLIVTAIQYLTVFLAKRVEKNVSDYLNSK